MALYRKYRPASFAEVVGQEHVTDPLSVALSSGRINHAYLFSGPRGCGKTSSARILARSLNCVHGPTATPCGECDSCVALAPGGNGTLDVTELDAASHGGVDDTRDLRERAFFAPASSRYRVLIIDEAHMVTNAGFNALLKIVEEPPEHLIFIFATTEPEKVLPTIRSRTHHYPFRLLTPTSMRGLLERICEQEGVQVEPTVFPLVIRSGGGSPRDTLSVLDQLMAGAGDEGITYPRAVSLLGATEVALIDDTVDALAAGDGATLFRTVDKVVEAGHDPRRFAADLLQRLRDLIMVQSVPQAIERGLVDAPVEQAETMRRQAENIGPATLARCADMVHEGMGSMRGATSPRLLLEILCAKLLLPSADDSMIALLQRVESLESGAVRPAAVTGAVGDGGAAPGGTPQGDDDESRPGPAGGPAPQDPGQADRRPKFVRRSQQQSAPAAEQPTPQAPEPSPAVPNAPAQPDQPERPTQPTQPDQSAQVDQPAPPDQPTQPDQPAPSSPAMAADPAAPAVPAASVAEQIAANRTSESESWQTTQPPQEEQAPPAGQVPQARQAPQAGQAPPTGQAPQADRDPQTGQAPQAGKAPRTDQAPRDPQPVRPGQPPGAEQRPTSGDSATPVSAPAAGPAAASAPTEPGPAASTPAPSTPASSTPAASVPAETDDPWRDERSPTPVASAPEQATSELDPAPQPGSASAPAAGAPGIEAEDIRRAWPAIRDAVRTRTRTVEVMLAGATVAGVDGRVIHLVHDYAPLAKRLSQPHNATAITDSIAEVVGGDWTIRCTSGSAPAAAGGAPAPADGAPPAPGRGSAAGPTDAPGAPQQGEPRGWERRLRGTDVGQGRAGGRAGGGDDDIPPPPEEPGPEPGEPNSPPPPPVSEEEMVDEARSGPQNLDHRTGEDIALALLKEHLGARPLER
ncbi:DNA polymerase III subunit gamma and tau [Dietzia sp. B32]|uniref:DNA polymerase III subunit gamma and tau n=1 Tax=Dietzia sp. B32 TaxID=2915130 RepID=UPI0021ADCCBA|nr:DNA polymerase III subunit gamma and tau [Dietzia sp. B32]UVE94371.1 DNA polymerase III subunit gamma and tau [Dietzia sp. B32]